MTTQQILPSLGVLSLLQDLTENNSLLFPKDRSFLLS